MMPQPQEKTIPLKAKVKQKTSLDGRKSHHLLSDALETHRYIYQVIREERSRKAYTSFFGLPVARFFGGFSYAEKLEAMKGLVKAVHAQEKGEQVLLDKKHRGPLMQGELGEILKKLNIDPDDYISPSGPGSNFHV